MRVDKALASGTAAWAGTDVGAALSFGYHALDSKKTLRKKLTVKNYTGSGRWYTITPSFRYADDAASGAVEVDTPSGIWVPAGKTRKFEVELRIDPSKLPVWAASGLNGGPTGGDGFRLQSLEFDGYISDRRRHEQQRARRLARAPAPRGGRRRGRLVQAEEERDGQRSTSRTTARCSTASTTCSR